MKNQVKNIPTLPPVAMKELFNAYVEHNDPKFKLEVIADPLVPGCFAARVTRSSFYEKNVTETIDLLWTGRDDEFDEVEFTSWPPTSGNLRFF